MRGYLPDRKQWGRYLAFSQIGMEMVAPIGLGAWVDITWGTKPWLSVVGTLLGLSAGMTHLFYLLRKIEEAEQKERGQDRP